jgi:hypothetical protein
MRLYETGRRCGRRFPLRKAGPGEKRLKRRKKDTAVCERRSPDDEENHATRLEQKSGFGGYEVKRERRQQRLTGI